jgi:AraC family transcriptional regulator
MDGSRLSRFPHLSWLRARFELRPDSDPLRVHERSVNHYLSLTLTGRHAVRWIHRNDDRRWTAHAGTLHFRPCDGEHSHFVVHSESPGDVVAFYIPDHHLHGIAHSEGIERLPAWRRQLIPNDPVLRQALLTMASCDSLCPGSAGRADEAARRLILRLTEISGGGSPDWHNDASVFDRRTMDDLVASIDAHLVVAPSLSDLGWRVGVSPSHFAKKFRHSTGLSLCRFINRRRILRSLETLKTDAPLASIALDLGFSSQSHFTRIFSGLTGMTPARYQKQARRIVG